MPEAPTPTQATSVEATRPARGAPRLPVSAQRRDEDVARVSRQRLPRRGRRVLYTLLALIVIAMIVAAVAGARDATAMQEAAESQYRSITGDGGYDTERSAVWGNCAVAAMSDGRTAILTKTDGAWHVVRHSTYTAGYDLDSVTSASTCNRIASDAQEPSYP